MTKTTPTRNKPKQTLSITKANFILIVALCLMAGVGVGSRLPDWQLSLKMVTGQQIDQVDGLDFARVKKAYRLIEDNYDGQIKNADANDGLIKGLVASLGDPYSEYLTEDESKEFKRSLAGDIGGGIGAELAFREGRVEIAQPLEDSPAAKAGLRPRDIIVKVDDEDITGQSMDRVLPKIRGEIDSKVKLEIAREGESGFLPFEIVRQQINNPSVKLKFNDQIAIMKISRFDEKLPELAKAKAQEVLDKKAKGLVVDLRGNSGGYVRPTSDLAGLWLDNKLILIEKSQDKVVSRRNSIGRQDILKDMPTVILADGFTASASEIFAGALQHYKKAKLIGEKTYGKGSEQGLIQTSFGGQLKLTSRRWLLPDEKSVDRVGLQPDQVVEFSLEAYNKHQDPQLDAAIKTLQ